MRTTHTTFPLGARRVLHAAFAASFLIGSSAAAQAEYVIQSGDTLELSVAGLPDLKQQTTVGISGEITLPLVRVGKVKGLTLAEAQKHVKELLSTKLYQQRGPDGRENVTAIPPDAITLTIAEYRPVYLNGDVTKPGEQRYRPGLTVRQAVALAGGYEIMRFRMNNPFLETADLRGDHQSLWANYATEQARIWRLQMELDPKTKLSLEEMTQAPIPTATLTEIRNLARRELTERLTKLSAERDFLKKAVSRSEEQIAILNDRRAKEEEGVKADAVEYDRLRDFSQRGQLTTARLSESRRLFLLSSTQSLQTTVQITESQQQRDEALRKLDRLSEDRRLEIMRELQASNENAAELQAKLQAVGEKIVYTGMIRSQLTRGGASAPTIRIFRTSEGKSTTVEATEDTEVMPGDTIEVALQTERPDVVPSR